MAAITSVGESAPAERSARPGGMQAGRRRKLNLFRYLVFTLFGLFFFLPLISMLRFSVEGKKTGSWSLVAWGQIASYPGLLSAIEITGPEGCYPDAGGSRHAARGNSPLVR